MSFGARKSRGDVVGYALRCLASRAVLDEILVGDSFTELVEWCANI